jgi:hypothetical protein
MRRVLLVLSGLILLSSCGTKNADVREIGNATNSILRSSSASSLLPYPLPDGATRIAKKPFGIFVSPGHSPVSPERFTGYHTGTDFETFANEKDSDVSVSAVCAGNVLFTGWVKGYGGVLVQSCSLEGKPVTVLYGHLRSSSIVPRKGDAVSVGGKIAVLGTGLSTETDGERKHLHLSVHRGSSIDFRGYAQTQQELDQWIDAYPAH